MKKLLLVALVLVAGCSTIIEGEWQEILVNTSPAGAACELTRDGQSIATVNPTPGFAYFEKTKDDITIACTMDGYEPASFVNKSDSAAATFGNIILGGVVGWGIDSATGSDNKYDNTVNITMTKK